MRTLERYYNYINDLFDASVDFSRLKNKLSGLSSSDPTYAQTDKACKEAEQKFLRQCQAINDEYAATNPKTEEVKALKQVMDALHQGHYATI